MILMFKLCNTGKFGANAILGVSLAVCRAGAAEKVYSKNNILQACFCKNTHSCLNSSYRFIFSRIYY